MMEIIIIGILVAGAITYLIISTKRVLKEPLCTCESEDKCPYAESLCNETECPLDKKDS